MSRRDLIRNKAKDKAYRENRDSKREWSSEISRRLLISKISKIKL